MSVWTVSNGQMIETLRMRDIQHLFQDDWIYIFSCIHLEIECDRTAVITVLLVETTNLEEPFWFHLSFDPVASSGLVNRCENPRWYKTENEMYSSEISIYMWIRKNASAYVRVFRDGLFLVSHCQQWLPVVHHVIFINEESALVYHYPCCCWIFQTTSC